MTKKLASLESRLKKNPARLARWQADVHLRKRLPDSLLTPDLLKKRQANQLNRYMGDPNATASGSVLKNIAQAMVDQQYGDTAEQTKKAYDDSSGRIYDILRTNQAPGGLYDQGKVDLAANQQKAGAELSGARDEALARLAASNQLRGGLDGGGTNALESTALAANSRNIAENRATSDALSNQQLAFGQLGAGIGAAAATTGAQKYSALMGEKNSALISTQQKLRQQSFENSAAATQLGLKSQEITAGISNDAAKLAEDKRAHNLTAAGRKATNDLGWAKLTANGTNAGKLTPAQRRAYNKDRTATIGKVQQGAAAINQLVGKGIDNGDGTFTKKSQNEAIGIIADKYFKGDRNLAKIAQSLAKNKKLGPWAKKQWKAYGFKIPSSWK